MIQKGRYEWRRQKMQIHDECLGVSELRILIKLYSSEVIIKRDLVIHSMVRVLVA